MQYAEGTVGRVFVLRLEDGERLPDAIEAFAAEKQVRCAACWLLGGLGPGTIVAGPKEPDIMPPEVIMQPFGAPREALAVGTLFEDEDGAPKLHMHAAMGRSNETLTGCIRPGVDTWLVGEVVIMELTGLDLLRKKDEASGLALLARR